MPTVLANLHLCFIDRDLGQSGAELGFSSEACNVLERLLTVVLCNRQINQETAV